MLAVGDFELPGVGRLQKTPACGIGVIRKSGKVTRRVSEEMLQVNTRSSLTRRVTVLSLLEAAEVMIKATRSR